MQLKIKEWNLKEEFHFDFRTEPREVSVKGKFTNIKDIEIEIKKNMLKQLEEE